MKGENGKGSLQFNLQRTERMSTGELNNFDVDNDKTEVVKDCNHEKNETGHDSYEGTRKGA